jgi:predicted metal-binding protein
VRGGVCATRCPRSLVRALRCAGGARSFTAIGESAADTNVSQQVLAALAAGGCPPSESWIRRTLRGTVVPAPVWLMGCPSARVPALGSGFARFRFSPQVITVT